MRKITREFLENLLSILIVSGAFAFMALFLAGIFYTIQHPGGF